MRSMAALLAVATALPSVLAASAEDEYQSLMWESNTIVPVILTLPEKPAIGALAGKINFQGVWACDFTLRYGGIDANVTTYFFSGTGGGRCGSLTAGHLESRQDGSHLVIRLFNKNGEPELSNLSLTRS